MIRPPSMDFWSVGLVPTPISSLLRPGELARHAAGTVWLPPAGPGRYVADPFGVQRGGHTHVFVEAFDYQTKHGAIEHHEFDGNLRWMRRGTALAESVHLSYPFIIEEAGEIFMVPESHRAGELVLYRANRFPDRWTREAVLLAGLPIAEASFLRHEGRWWMFYTLVGPQARDQRELHAAHAEQLTGPWQAHPLNPLLEDRCGARPGGTPFVADDGVVTLPVQDCGITYGGAVRFARFRELSPRHAVIEHAPVRLTSDSVSTSHPSGLHTVSACGSLTLIDAKRTVRTWARYKFDVLRRISRLRHKVQIRARRSQAT